MEADKLASNKRASSKAGSDDVGGRTQVAAPSLYLGFMERATGSQQPTLATQPAPPSPVGISQYGYYNPYQAGAAAMYMSTQQMALATQQQQQQQAAAAAAWMAQAPYMGLGTCPPVITQQTSPMANLTSAAAAAAATANPFAASPYNNAAAAAQMLYMSAPYDVQQYLAVTAAAAAAAGVQQQQQQLQPQHQQPNQVASPNHSASGAVASTPSLPLPPPPAYYQASSATQNPQQQISASQINSYLQQGLPNMAGMQQPQSAAMPPPQMQRPSPQKTVGGVGSVAYSPTGAIPSMANAPAAALSPAAFPLSAAAAQPVIPLELNVLSVMPNTRLPAGVPFCPPGVALPKEYANPTKSITSTVPASVRTARRSTPADPGSNPVGWEGGVAEGCARASTGNGVPQLDAALAGNTQQRRSGEAAMAEEEEGGTLSVPIPTAVLEPVVGSSYAKDIITLAARLLETKLSKGSAGVAELHQCIHSWTDVGAAVKDRASLDFIEAVLAGSPNRFKMFQYSASDLEAAGVTGIQPNEVRFGAVGVDYKVADGIEDSR